MDMKMFEAILNDWKQMNNLLQCVLERVNCYTFSYGQRAILLNLFKGINRMSFKIVKILEEAKTDEKNED